MDSPASALGAVFFLDISNNMTQVTVLCVMIQEVTIAPRGGSGEPPFLRCLLTRWGKYGKIKVFNVDMDTMTQRTVPCVTSKYFGVALNEENK